MTLLTVLGPFSWSNDTAHDNIDSSQDNENATNLIFGEDDLEVPAFLRNGSN